MVSIKGLEEHSVEKILVPRNSLSKWQRLGLYGVATVILYVILAAKILTAFNDQTVQFEFSVHNRLFLYTTVGTIMSILAFKCAKIKDFKFVITEYDLNVFVQENILIYTIKLCRTYQTDFSSTSVYLKFQDYNFLIAALLFFKFPFYVLFAWKGIRLNTTLFK